MTYQLSRDTFTKIDWTDIRQYNASDLVQPSGHPHAERSLLYDDDEMDDDFDPEFDSEMEDPIGLNSSDNYGMIMATTSNQDDRRPRSNTAYLDGNNVLARYRPTAFASPLMDPETARIFCHFLTCVGPMISIFERHPVNPTIMLTGTPV